MKETKLSPAELMQRVYIFYPRHLSSSDNHYSQSPEWQKLKALQEEKWKNREGWLAMLKALRSTFPGSWVVDETVPMRLPSYRCQLYPKECSAYRLPQYQTVIGFVSYLAPVYTVCAFHSNQVGNHYQAENLSSVFSKETILYAYQLMDEIEKEFHYEFLPIEKALEKVPDVAVGNHLMGEAKLFHYLFDAHESL